MSENGGESWKHIFIDSNTGISDMVMDPDNLEYYLPEHGS